MMQAQTKSHGRDEIVVVCAADDGYAMPLAVTIRSLLDHLGKGRRVRLFVLDGGLSPTTHERLLKSWQDGRLTVEWVKPDLQLVSGFSTSGHISASSYLRLLVSEVLPTEISRAIYLDADLLVQRDIGELWDVPMEGHAALVGQDVGAPWMDSAAMLPNFAKCKGHLSAITPVANFRELGIAADVPYFNAGVMVIDLDQWRREKYAEKFLACLRDNREHVRFWDQYPLNVILHERCGHLDKRWNQAAHIYLFSTWDESPFDQETYDRLRDDPWIVHFCTSTKPWEYFCRHPFAKAWRACQYTTDWRDERPKKFIKRLWDNHYRPVRHSFKRTVKSVTEAVQSKLRKAG